MSQPTTDRSLEAGLFLVIVALPLLFTPFSAAPFADPKLLLLTLGAVLIAHSHLGYDRQLGLVSAVWVVALILASVVGVDPLWSLLGAPNQGTGLIALGASSLLLCAGTGVPSDLRVRLGAWLFWTGVVVAAVTIIGRFVDVGGATWQLGSLSSTLGHRVFAGGFLAAATIAALSLTHGRYTMVGLVVVSSGLAVTAVRAAWIGALIGIAWAIWRGRTTRRAALAVVLTVAFTLAAWTAGDRFLPKREIEFSAAPRFAQLAEGSAAQRPPVWRAYLRSWSRNPVLGTGLATGWNGFLLHATPDEITTAGRGWDDAHNFPLEIAATSGVVGLLPLIAIALLVTMGALRAPPSHAWASGVAIALAVVHGLQPLNIVLTPLLFLTAGLGVSAREGRRSRRWMVIILLIATIFPAARFVASSLERYGDTYDSVTALTWSGRIEPQRLGADQTLAYLVAFDHGPREAAEARVITRRVVDEHAWHPDVRLIAAEVAVFLGDISAGRRWLDEHLEIFPNDSLALIGAGNIALRAGQDDEAAALARRALEINPDDGRARRLLEATTPN